MANDNSNTFGILDLFALMTLCALAMAFATPFIQSLGKAPSRNLVFVLWLQLVFFVGAFGMSLASRQKALRIAGAKLGRGYLGNLKWRHWPVVCSLIQTTIFAFLQLGFAIVTSMAVVSLLGSIIYNVQLSLFGGHAVARYMWRAFPGTIDFYEGGILFSGTCLCTWDECQLRPSKIYEDRVVVVYGSKGVQDTKLAKVDAELRAKLEPYIA